MGRLFLEEARPDGVPAADRDGDLADAYARLLADPDLAVRERAARDWCRWEDTHAAIRPDHRPDPWYDDAAFRMTFARLVTTGATPASSRTGPAGRGGPPGRDPRGPDPRPHGRQRPAGHWELARAWPGAELVASPRPAIRPATRA